mmetsp:Transcript_19546/g.60698  ORF Transcript_19546/g.60698 Transcript_19546/m.60698 type:complete len:123 (+) Transcript_19546:83-451(+)
MAVSSCIALLEAATSCVAFDVRRRHAILRGRLRLYGAGDCTSPRRLRGGGTLVRFVKRRRTSVGGGGAGMKGKTTDAGGERYALPQTYVTFVREQRSVTSLECCWRGNGVLSRSRARSSRCD